MKLDTDEIVWTTFYTIQRIREHKNWGDMLLLYFAYIEQRRIQDNKRTYSLDIFMQKKMNWWEKKLCNAKKWLKELWLIEYVQLRDEFWKIKTIYVIPKFEINAEKARENHMTYEIETTTAQNHGMDNPRGGEGGTNTLVLENKYPSTITKYTGKEKKIAFGNPNALVYKDLQTFLSTSLLLISNNTPPTPPLSDDKLQEIFLEAKDGVGWFTYLVAKKFFKHWWESKEWFDDLKERCKQMILDYFKEYLWKEIKFFYPILSEWDDWLSRENVTIKNHKTSLFNNYKMKLWLTKNNKKN